jgi:hypothetical protein
MIYLTFKLDNPFNDRFANLFNRSGKLSKNKSWEVEILKVNSFVNFQLQYTTRTDHAGLRFELGLFGYELGFTIYDIRHWDYENNDWKVYT